jgi:hypothetical protein
LRMEQPTPATRSRITLRALLLGALTIGLTFYYAITEVQGQGVGGFVLSQMPILVLVPFFTWLFLNVALKWLWPAIALSRDELLTIFCMLWVVGTVPHIGWSGYWVIVLAIPTYFASAENQWADVFFDLMPWHLFPDSSARVIDGVWQGLPQGAEIPWEGWLGPIAQWLGVSMGLVVFGFCLVAVFQRQWESREKLTFPLAQLPLDLTAGFDSSRRLPDIFRSRLFWIGFFLVFGVVVYNVATYFSPGMSPMGIYWERYEIEFPEPYPSIRVRIMPLIMAVTYLCPLDILGSMVFFHLLAKGKMGVIDRLGLSFGAEGRTLTSNTVLHLESYGAMIFIGLWSVWLARGHLRRVWQQVRLGTGDRADVRLYRLAVGGLLLSAIYVVSWLMMLGMSPQLAVLVFLVTVLTYLVIVKLIAATGCAYLLTDWGHVKAESFVHELLGTERLSPQSIVGFGIYTSRSFFGNLRIPAWPSLPHVLRIFPLREQPGWVLALIFFAFPVGFLTAVGATLEMGYVRGGLVSSAGGAIGEYDQMARLLQNPTATDPDRWGIFSFGLLESACLAFLRGHFHWFPLHPVGVAFQNTIVSSLYWFSLFLVWLVKLILLRYGGVRAYLTGKPFFYGLGVGYVTGVILSVTVDLIWFPGSGHLIHNW